MAELIINETNRYTVEPLFQWDKNQILKIYGLSVTAPEIHFSNESMSRSIVEQATVNSDGVITVNIPNSLLQKSSPIVVYVCGYEGDTFKTYCKITVPVKARTKPGDYTLETSDGEVYSFNELSKKITELERIVNVDAALTLYSYTYNESSADLDEKSNNINSFDYIPLISSSLKAIKSLFSKIKTIINSVNSTATEALSIAKGKNRARVFSTTEDMEAWLSDVTNVGVCNVGDNLYIVDTEVPDWWISEVLNVVDETTGFYYKIAKLETQKVDLTTIESNISSLQTNISSLQTADNSLNSTVSANYTTLLNNINTLKSDLAKVTFWTNNSPTAEFAATTINLSLSSYNRFTIILAPNTVTQKEEYQAITIDTKNIQYSMICGGQFNDGAFYHRYVKITNSGVIFSDGSEFGYDTVNNNYCIPYKIIAYKY